MLCACRYCDEQQQYKNASLAVTLAYPQPLTPTSSQTCLRPGAYRQCNSDSSPNLRRQPRPHPRESKYTQTQQRACSSTDTAAHGWGKVAKNRITNSGLPDPNNAAKLCGVQTFLQYTCTASHVSARCILLFLTHAGVRSYNTRLSVLCSPVCRCPQPVPSGLSTHFDYSYPLSQTFTTFKSAQNR